MFTVEDTEKMRARTLKTRLLTRFMRATGLLLLIPLLLIGTEAPTGIVKGSVAACVMTVIYEICGYWADLGNTTGEETR